MTVTREEKTYRAEIEERLLKLEEPDPPPPQTPGNQFSQFDRERLQKIEQVLMMPGGIDPDDESVEVLSGWRKMVEGKVDDLNERLNPLSGVGQWVDRTHERLSKLEKEPAKDHTQSARLDKIENVLIMPGNHRLSDWRHRVERRQESHRATLFGDTEVKDGLLYRVVDAEKALKDLGGELWWIRKGVLIILILTIWVLVDIWRMAGWWPG